MPINPVQFAHGVCDEFLRYIFSAFPLSDPELAEQARKLLEAPVVARHPAGQGAVRLALRSVRQGRVGPGDGRPRACCTRHAGADRLPDDVAAPAAGLRGGQGRAARPGRHRHRVGQDRVVPLPHHRRPAAAAGPGHHDGADGDPRLPDERPGQRPVGPPAGHARRHRASPSASGSARRPAKESDVQRGPLPRLRPAGIPGRPPASAGKRPRPRTGPCAPWPRPKSAAPRRTSASASPASC